MPETIKFRHQVLRVLPIIMLACSLLPAPTRAQLTQQAKLVGKGAIGAAVQGQSVSLSSDGNTAIVGAPGDNAVAGVVVGAAWVYTRSGAVWSQQAKLVGTGAVNPVDFGATGQGFSVSLSGDGNTAIVDSPGDNSGIEGAVGAVWVYTRSGAVWSQETKLVGTGAIGDAEQGWSVSVSGDGNTAIVGGLSDNGETGAAWVYTRSRGLWSQQAKLVGTGAIGAADQGSSVSLSDDGRTAIVAAPGDNNNAGAAWVYTRSRGLWSQQAKLVDTGAISIADQGQSVSLSSDGNTAIVGGPFDGPNVGAAWVYTRSR